MDWPGSSPRAFPLKLLCSIEITRPTAAPHRANSLIHWKIQTEYGSLAGLALDRDRAVVLIHDFRHDRQSEAHTIRLSSEEWVEDILKMFFLNSGAAVNHRDLHLILNQPGLDRHGAARHG